MLEGVKRVTARRAVLYARVSYDDRENDGRNLAGQLEMAREYAQSRGYRIVAEFAEDDRGASGAAFELPQLDQIRKLAQAGDFDVLIPREIDRLSRSLAKQLIVEEEMRRFGVQIEYALGDYSDTPEGRLNKHIKATIAEYEREKVIERTARGRRSRVQSGSVFVSGHPPYGYRQAEQDGRRVLVINEAEAQVVRMAFAWFVHGDGNRGPMPLRTIARALNELDLPVTTHGVRQAEEEWQHSTVRCMLKNETYAGRWTYGKHMRNGKPNSPDHYLYVEVPAIVSRETWAVAQEQLRKNSERASRNMKYEYLIRGRLRCGRCAQPVYGKGQKQGGRPYTYYVCSGRPEGCDLQTFDGREVDATIWNWLTELLSDAAALRAGLEQYRDECRRENAPIQQRLDVVDDLIADSRRQLKRLLDLYLTTDFPKEMLTERKARLETTVLALERERADLVEHMEARTLTDEEIRGIQGFAAEVAEGLEAASDNFQARRQIVEKLDVQATVAVDEGRPTIHARCRLGTQSLSIESTTTCGSSPRRNLPPVPPGPARPGPARALRRSRSIARPPAPGAPTPAPARSAPSAT